ncbi:MAG: acyltransferase family protein [Acidiferrobacterales bacterium]
MNQEQLRYTEIDYLRGYAVAFVIVLHVIGAYMGTSPELEHIFAKTDFEMGVDLFFAISGFVISRSLNQFWSPGGIDKSVLLSRTLVFWQKRFIRLWPSAAFWLLVNLLCVFTFRANHMWPSVTDAIQKVISGLVYVSDFAENRQASVIGYFWSLAVEWQFYVILPLLLIFVRRDFIRVAFLIVALIASIAMMPGGLHWWMFRFDGIVYGIFAYILFFRLRVELPIYRSLHSPYGRAAFTALMLAAIVIVPPAVQPYRIGASISALLGAILVSAGAENRGYISTFGMRPFVSWMGSRSYSLYLCHFPCLLISRGILAHFITVYGAENPSRPELYISYALIFGLIAITAELSYRFIEYPSHSASHAISFRIEKSA